MLDLNKPAIVRQAELAFTGAFHELPNADIDLALKYGETVVNFANTHNLKNPLSASSLLAEIALFGYTYEAESLTRDASIAGMDLAVYSAPCTAEKLGLIEPEREIVIAKNRIVGSILAEEEVSEDISLQNEAIDRALKEYLHDYFLSDIDTYYRYRSRRIELATIQLFTGHFANRVFLDTSFILDESHSELCYIDAGVETVRSIAIDAFGVALDDPLRNSIVHVQTKRSTNSELVDMNLPYAPHILPLTWTDHLPTIEINKLETGHKKSLTVCSQSEIETMLNWASKHFGHHARRMKKGYLTSAYNSPIFLEYI